MQLAKYSPGVKPSRDPKSLKRRLQHALSGIVIFLTTMLASGSLFAQSSGSSCPPAVTDLVYSNGVLNTVSQAMISEVKLCQSYSGHLLAVAASGTSPVTLHCGLAVNQTEGLIGDLLEAALLSVQSSVTEFFRMLSGIDAMPAAFQTALQNVAAEAAIPDVTGGDLTSQVAMYQGFAAAGDKVVIVAHSEGNFFANLAYAQLSESDAAHVGVIGVADPDSYVAAGGPYTTFDTDLIIQVATAARELAGLTTLPPNASASTLAGINNTLNHAFVEAYLASAGATILENIDTVSAGLTGTSACVEPVLPTYGYVGNALAPGSPSEPAGGPVIVTVSLTQALPAGFNGVVCVYGGPGCYLYSKIANVTVAASGAGNASGSCNARLPPPTLQCSGASLYFVDGQIESWLFQIYFNFDADTVVGGVNNGPCDALIYTGYGGLAGGTGGSFDEADAVTCTNGHPKGGLVYGVNYSTPGTWTKIN
jgi:hypothetical protein